MVSGKKSDRPKNRKTPLQEEFGKIVRLKRTNVGLSQEKLAEKAQLHFTYISSVERGERNISLENIAKIAAALESKMSDLMPE